MGETLKSILLRGAFSDFAVKTVGVILVFISQVVLAQFAGHEEYGDYVFVMAWVLVLSLVARLGLDTTLLRFLSAYLGTGEFGRMKGILRWTTRVILMSGFATAMAFAVGSTLALGPEQEDLLGSFLIAAVIVPLAALTQLRVYSLRALHHVVFAQLPELILNPMVVMTGVAIVYFMDLPVDSGVIIAFTLAATALSVSIGSLSLRVFLPPAIQGAKPETCAREWASAALPMLFVSGASIIIMQSDVLMLGLMTGTESSGVYSAATRVAVLTSFGLVVVNSLAAPMIAKYFALKDFQHLAETARFSARVGLYVVIPVIVGVILFGQDILGLFGTVFREGYWALIILSMGQFVNVLCGSVGILLTMTGNQRVAAGSLTISAVVNVVLNAALIPKFGIEGAATATAVATGLWNILLLFHVIRLLKINPTVLPLRSSDI